MPDRPSEPPFDPRSERPRDPRIEPPYERGNRPPLRGSEDAPYGDEFGWRGGSREGWSEQPDAFPERDGPRFQSRQGSSSETVRAGGARRRPILIIAGLIGLLLVALFAYRLARGGPNQDRLDDGTAAGNSASAQASSERCGTQRTYDLVKTDLFRRAAQVRGSDQSAFDRLSAYAVVRVEAPVLKRQDAELGTQVCSGTVSLDLPPGVGVVGGRRTLTAEMDYALQPAADGSGDVVTLSGADAIVVPLATLARTGTQPGVPEAAPGGQPLPQAGGGSAQPPAAVPVPATPGTAPTDPNPPAPVSAATARPSFDCDDARTRGEIAVCGSPELASLDRQMASFYVQSYRSADGDTKALLERTRTRFLTYRDRCRNDACVADAYRGRISEIRDIVDGRWRGQ